MNKSTSLKQRQLSHLNSQLAQLQANLSDFNDLIGTTCYQYKSIEKLGVIHGSLFMASHTVFESDNFRDEISDEEEEVAEEDVVEEEA